MHKTFLILGAALTLISPKAAECETPKIGVVNFATCITDSKAGKKEQENVENIRVQMASLIEGADKELKEIASKQEDPEYMDSLSPKAIEELGLKKDTLQDNLAQYQNQFYQFMNHAQYQMAQKINQNISQAASRIAEEKGLDYVLNKEVCFYIRPDLDLTPSVIDEMDKSFELDSKAASLTENEQQSEDRSEQSSNKAG